MEYLRRILAVVGIALWLGAGAHAERFLFLRGTSLYVGSREGREVRRLLDVGAGALWAVAPDGRRIAWLKPVGTSEEGGMTTRPIALFLTDIFGRRQKKLLSTDNLKDRQRRPVKELAPLADNELATPVGDWAPVSLAWSADGRTLYLGCTQVGGSGVATVTIDAQTGAPVVDADGRWKSLAAVTQPDARGGVLAAVGAGKEVGVAPLVVRNLTQSDDWTTIPAKGTPAYGAALWPAVAPDGKTIAFASFPKGLWLADIGAGRVRRLISSDVARPRFAGDGRAILFLSPRPSTEEKPSFDLYELLPGTDTPRVILQNVDWFDVISD